MNNPLRALLQEKIEIKIVRKLSKLKSPHRVLEIGCGVGYGSKLIQSYFNPEIIHAVDLDSKMINLAKNNNQSNKILYQTADATRLPFKDNYFDAVFDFGVIHHIPNWKDCLQELRRVIKPGGELLVEDLSIETFNNLTGKILKIFTKHPYTTMYSSSEFIQKLIDLGFRIEKKKLFNPLGLIPFFVIIARK